MKNIDDYLFNIDHEWLNPIDGTIGISDYAQEALGDVVFADLPKVGSQINAGDAIGSIESIKAVSSIYSPVSGKVVGVNDKLESNPEVVNKDPYGDGWLFKIESPNKDDLKKLMSYKDYQEFLKTNS